MSSFAARRASSSGKGGWVDVSSKKEATDVRQRPGLPVRLGSPNSTGADILSQSRSHQPANLA